MLTGIDGPYEASLNPDVTIDTTCLTVDQAGQQILVRVHECGNLAVASLPGS